MPSYGQSHLLGCIMATGGGEEWIDSLYHLALDWTCQETRRCRGGQLGSGPMQRVPRARQALHGAPFPREELPADLFALARSSPLAPAGISRGC